MMRRFLLALILSVPSLAWAASFSPDTSCTLVDSNLKAYWNLDEASGTRSDSVGSNHLTDNNTVTQAGGIVSNAAQFTAANLEYLNLADNADMSTGDVSFTWVGWVYMDSGSVSGRVIADKGDELSGTMEWIVRLNGADKPAVAMSSNGTSLILDTTWGTALTAATWYFIVIWHDAAGDTLNIQVNDGTPVSSATSGSAPSDRAGAYAVGQTEVTEGFLYFNGRIDEMGWWKRVLTAQERTDLYNGGSGNTYGAGSCRTFLVSQAWKNPLTRLGFALCDASVRKTWRSP